MRRFGSISLYMGLLITVVALIMGFAALWAGATDWAKPLLMSVPVGFLLVFNGVITLIIYTPRAEQGPFRLED